MTNDHRREEVFAVIDCTVRCVVDGSTWWVMRFITSGADTFLAWMPVQSLAWWFYSQHVGGFPKYGAPDSDALPQKSGKRTLSFNPPPEVGAHPVQFLVGGSSDGQLTVWVRDQETRITRIFSPTDEEWSELLTTRSSVRVRMSVLHDTEPM
jgi:hypothetical protein